jgi:Hypervirulence associated proteins TUDOR domain
VSDDFKKGDKVEWNTPQGKTEGEVKEKVTGEKRIGNTGQEGTRVKGSEDDPRYVVESDKSGKQAAHKPDALDKK